MQEAKRCCHHVSHWYFQTSQQSCTRAARQLHAQHRSFRRPNAQRSHRLVRECAESPMFLRLCYAFALDSIAFLTGLVAHQRRSQETHRTTHDRRSGASPSTLTEAKTIVLPFEMDHAAAQLLNVCALQRGDCGSEHRPFSTQSSSDRHPFFFVPSRP